MTILTHGRVVHKQFMEKIIDEFLNYKDDHSNNTRDSYLSDLVLFTNFLRLKKIKEFSKVTPKNVEDFFTSEFLDTYERIWKDKDGNITKRFAGRRSESSKNRVISTLSSFYKYLIFKEKIAFSPIPKRSSKSEVVSQSLTRKEIQIILDFIKGESFSKAPKRDRLIIEALSYLGLRVSELIKVKMVDLKLKNSNPYIVIQGKGNKFRDQPIPTVMLQNLLNYIEIERKVLIKKNGDSDFLFISNYKSSTTTKANHLVRQQVNQIVNKISRVSLNNKNLSNRKSGKIKYKQISPHMFRHAIGTHLHRSGVDIIKVRDHLGHSSVSTTSRYVAKEREKASILEKYGPLSKK